MAATSALAPLSTAISNGVLPSVAGIFKILYVGFVATITLASATVVSVVEANANSRNGLLLDSALEAGIGAPPVTAAGATVAPEAAPDTIAPEAGPDAKEAVNWARV
jgi:hypothetical protein